MKEHSKNTSTLLFILLTGVLVMIAFISYNKIRQFNTSVDRVLHTQVVKDNIIELRSNVKDAESGQRGYLITNDSVFLQPVIGAEQRNILIFTALDSLVRDHAGQQKNLKKLKILLDQRYLLLNKTLQSFKNIQSANLPTDILLLKSKNKMDEVRKQIALMLQTEDTFLKQRIQVKDRSASITPIFLLLLSLFSIVALSFFFFRLQKETGLRFSKEKLVELGIEARKKIEENKKRTELDRKSLHDFFTQAPAMLAILKGPQHVFEFANPAYLELIGNRNPIGKTVLESLPEVADQGFIELLDNVYKTSETFIGKETPIKLEKENGKLESFFLNFTYQAFANDEGETEGVLVFAYDVTEQVIARKQIEASETSMRQMAAQLKLATNSANVGIWSLEMQTQKLEWSALHKKMWGYEEHCTDLSYEDWHKLILPGDKEKAFKKIEEARINNTVYDVEYRISSAEDETVRCIRSVGKYYYNYKGEAETLSGISFDITEKKQIEETLRYRKALLEAHNEANRDGLLLVDAKGKIISYNQSFIDVWRMPKEIVDAKDDELALAFAMTQLVNPQQFIDKVEWLYEHPSETSIDELEYLDGRIIERHGYSVLGDDGTYYAWSWTFRDITEQKAAAKAIKESEERVSKERMVLYNSFMNAPAAIAIVKGDTFIYEFANAEYEKLVDRKITIGKTVQEHFPEMEQQGIIDILNNVFSTGEPFINNEFPLELINKSTGKLVLGYYNTVVQPMNDEKGNTERLLSHGVEVTQHVNARKVIEASENQFRIFANSIQNLAWIANAEGWIYWYNQQWYDYTGTTFEEMEGWGWEKVHHPDHIKKLVDFSKVAWKKDEAFEQTFMLRRHDGEYRWFLTRAYPVKDANGNIERWIGTNTDINEQKITEQKKDEFISIASHEMKTPLTIAKGYIQLLLTSLSAENQTAIYAIKANQAIERLNDLATELLDASKIQNGQLDYNITTFDLNIMVDETIENIQHSATNHSLQKTGNCSQQITGDRGRLQQVLINFLTNAVKYSPYADKIFVKIDEQVGKVQVSVQDFGVGMSGNHLDKIFGRYYRVEEHASQFQGLGIGLYISYNIIERHDGKIWAESRPEKGSTFYFSLPL